MHKNLVSSYLGILYLSACCGACAGSIFTCEHSLLVSKEFYLRILYLWIFCMSSVYLRILYLWIFCMSSVYLLEDSLLVDLLHEQCLLEDSLLVSIFTCGSFA